MYLSGFSTLTIVFAVVFILASTAPSRAEDQEIITATKAGDLERVTQLLASGADPDRFDQNRNTALIFAARDGFFEIAKVLIHAGADVNWQDDEKVTPLILASFKNHPLMVRLLLDHGAKRDVQDQWERTALSYALRRGADDPIALMLAK